MRKVFILVTLMSLYSCNKKEKFECPCGGYGVVAHGTIIEIDEKYYRPAEVDTLLGDYKKAKEVLGWEPKVNFNELVKIMMMHDIKNIQKK